MVEYIITIDLGTTNIKVGIYNSRMQEIYTSSFGVTYINKNNFVEFKNFKKHINNWMKSNNSFGGNSFFREQASKI